MRKHDVRKWLHAVLDLLPVILIPVFMIYSHRHTIDSGSISVPQNQVVDFNQQVRNGNFNNTDYWMNISDDYNTLTSVDNTLKVDVLSTNMARYYYVAYNVLDEIKIGDEYLLRFDIIHNDFNVLVVEIGGDNQQSFTSSYVSAIFNVTNTYNNQLLFFPGSVSELGYYQIANVNLFNLTQMFGRGNEPTSQQFDTWYTSEYYEYTLSHKELLKGISTITYDDTDIMSQVVYQLYNSVDKYFNMGNVFNMTGVYDWFNLNIFNGNAPISIYIVWNIVLYEFVMDLLFLLYGLFMWFIDMVEKLMEKPLKSVK